MAKLELKHGLSPTSGHIRGTTIRLKASVIVYSVRSMGSTMEHKNPDSFSCLDDTETNYRKLKL